MKEPIKYNVCEDKILRPAEGGCWVPSKDYDLLATKHQVAMGFLDQLCVVLEALDAPCTVLDTVSAVSRGTMPENTELLPFVPDHTTGERGRMLSRLKGVTKAMDDLVFECDGLMQTRAPSRETYNNAFNSLQFIKLYLSQFEDKKPVAES